MIPDTFVASVRASVCIIVLSLGGFVFLHRGDIR